MPTVEKPYYEGKKLKVKARREAATSKVPLAKGDSGFAETARGLSCGTPERPELHIEMPQEAFLICKQPPGAARPLSPCDLFAKAATSACAAPFDKGGIVPASSLTRLTGFETPANLLY